jgi:hypothetical protein
VWRNPKFSPPDPPAPIEDQGRRLATLPRGNNAEMRINLASYQSRPYVSLRVWERGQDGNLYPSKKGCSVRIGEVEDVIAALRQIEDLVADGAGQGARQEAAIASTSRRPSDGQERPGGQPGAQDDRPQYVERRRRPEPRTFDPAPLRTPAGPADQFDEFT